MSVSAHREVLRLLILGGSCDSELLDAVERFEGLCAGSGIRGPAEPASSKLRLNFRDVARQLQLHLKGNLTRHALSRWVDALHALVSANASCFWIDAERNMKTSLGVLSLILDRGYTAPPDRLLRSLQHINRRFQAGRPILSRQFLPGVFRDMACMQFRPLESPFEFFTSSQDQWVDVGLVGPPTTGGNLDGAEPPARTLRVIPFSVFTRTFFRHDLPVLLSLLARDGPFDGARCDEFYYHPENNLAIPLKERHPEIRSTSPDFQYYVDCDGLAEIVLDTPVIGRQELLFAAKLFCLLNRVRRATLDGVHVPGTMTPLR